MTTPPPGEGTHELADMPQLSDVQATDALLDRLAARTPNGDDLADPIVADLVRLAEFADAGPTPDLAVGRLIEVLDGRPLYMFPRNSQPATEADQPIQLDLGRPAARMIDVSDPAVAGSAPAGAAAPSSDGDGEERDVAARTASPGVASLAVVRAVRAANARRLAGQRMPGWQGAVQQMALPAASVVIIALLGGGVSAVVTGDPMSPINGVTNIASQLPGLDGRQEKIDLVTADIVRADQVVGTNTQQASRYLDHAQKNLAEVPEGSKKALRQKIADVSKKMTDSPVKVPSGTSPDPGTTQSPAPSPTATSSAAPSATPSQSVTESQPVTVSPTPSSTPSDPATSGVNAVDTGGAGTAP